MINNSHRSRDGSPGRPFQFIDLFCGCGGFSLGMERSGLRALAAIDSNTEAIVTFGQNLPHVPHVLQRDLKTFRPQELDEILGGERVDVIVGGPPCQGFSTARQRDGANHGQRRLIQDDRRYLYQEFLRFVDYFQPKIFVMENVLGIRSAAGGEYLTRVQKEARSLGYRVNGQVEDAWRLGVPQKRRRQLIIGVRSDLIGYFPLTLAPAPRADPHTPLGAAIGDLPILRAGGGVHDRDYDLATRERHIRNWGAKARNYLSRVLEIERTPKLTNHVARPHSDRDLRDFRRLREGENSATAVRNRGVEFEFPYDKSTFKDRYTRQSRQRPCSTIVAHLSKDGLMFIHPTQNRSLTPREAARIQTFPDWFRLPRARTHAFRLIGNAVPPLVAESVGLAVNHILSDATDSLVIAPTLVSETGRSSARTLTMLGENAITGEHSADALQIPRSVRAAGLELQRLGDLDRRQLMALSQSDFLRGWYALLFLFPNLHPGNALDHGVTIETVVSDRRVVAALTPLVSRRYARSGWPVALEIVGREAWRRYESLELNDVSFYCVAAQRAGLTDIRR